MFTTIKVVSRHEDTQLYAAILPDELTNEAIKDSESYKQYYAIALGAEPPKTKASVKKKQAGSNKTKTPPIAKGKRLKTFAKEAKLANDEEDDDEVAKNDDDNDNDDENDNDYDDDKANNQDDEGQEYDVQDDKYQDDDDEQTDSDNDGDDF
ncbi:hypothetical protein Tco_0224306, partial [Tanacetum coccineum]